MSIERDILTNMDLFIEKETLLFDPVSTVKFNTNLEALERVNSELAKLAYDRGFVSSNDVSRVLDETLGWPFKFKEKYEWKLRKDFKDQDKEYLYLDELSISPPFSKQNTPDPEPIDFSIKRPTDQIIIDFSTEGEE